MDQLVNIAARLDHAGFDQHVGFLRDLLLDGDRVEYIYIDAGSDMGEPSGTPTSRSQPHLLGQFPMYTNYIHEQYAAARKELK